MSGVTVYEDGDWIIVARMEGPPGLKRELHRVLEADWERDEDGTPRIARKAWPAARAVFSRFGVGITPVLQESGMADDEWSASPPGDAEEGDVVDPDVRQRVAEEDRAVEQEIAALQAQIAELERKREEFRLFLAIYERFATADERHALEAGVR